MKKFLDASLQRHVNASCFTHKALKRVFIKMNAVVPSSAAVERVFTIGKGILKAKRSGLNDVHFEMLLFLKANNWNHVGCVIISFLDVNKTAKFCNFS